MPQTKARRTPFHLIASSMLMLGTLVSPVQAEDQKIIRSHGYSFYGDLKYPPDYKHFDYVNPDAPKGGEISYGRVGSVDSMNPFNGKGRADLLSVFHYESLLGEAPSREAAPADVYAEYYCLLCESLEYPEDKSWVIFHLRKDVKFNNGTPLTAHDVVFTQNFYLDGGLKSAADSIRKRIPNVEALDDYTVKFTFADGISRRSLIEIAGGWSIWSKEWFERTGATMKDDWRKELPPGTGPYKIVSADLNRNIVLERRDDYWGEDLPFNVGRNNFDRIRMEIFSDATAAFQAFKTGLYTFRRETESQKWANAYVFPKVENGYIVREDLPDGTPPLASGFVFNLGKEVFEDKRVRQAIALMYNFEWTNESLQYGLFKQRASFTQDTPLMATGAPQGAELALLKSLGDMVPPEMLTEEALTPHTSKPEKLRDRRNARKASKLLDEAGWTVGDDGKRRNAKGEVLTLKFLSRSSASPTLSAILENFVNNVGSIGVNIILERVDDSQYTARERDRDYDLLFGQYSPFLGTGTGLQQSFGSEAASFSLFNPAGIASPLVDALIDASQSTNSREEEHAALMALDRALRYEFIMIPLWYNDSHWVAYYDMYEHPEIPAYALGYLDFWWYNAEKAQKLRDAGVLR